MRAAYEGALPLEAAGFLFSSDRQKHVVSSVALVRGSAGGRGEFAVPDYELRRIRAWADDRAVHIVALFHTHPGGDLQLSPADRAALLHSEWPWVIVTRAPGRARLKLAAYRPLDGQRVPCRIDT